MGGFNVYNDINARTNGEIYIGVVGSGTNRKINIYQTVYGNDGHSKYKR